MRHLYTSSTLFPTALTTKKLAPAKLLSSSTYLLPSSGRSQLESNRRLVRSLSRGSTVKVVQEGLTARSIVLPAAVAAGRTNDTMNSTRTAIEQHWRASEEGDTEAEHAIYAVDAILDYPQSGERFRGHRTIAEQRGGHPAERHFTVLRISGDGNLWVSECIITYDGVSTYSVSIMEFAGELVAHETQYFADTFKAPASRAALAEPMPGRHIERV